MKEKESQSGGKRKGLPADKTKYSKKAYTPPKNKIKIDKWSKSLITQIKKILKKNPNHPSKELFIELFEMGKNGADLELICNEIEFYKNPIDKFLEPQRDAYFAESYNANMKKLGNQRKALMAKVRQIMKLPQLENPYDDLINKHMGIRRLILERRATEHGKKVEIINRKLKKIQSSIERTIEDYLYEKEALIKMEPSYLLPAFATPGKRINNNKGTNQQINLKLILIFNELDRLKVYSDQNMYKIIEKLFKLSFPTLQPLDADLIRNRITYHKRKILTKNNKPSISRN